MQKEKKKLVQESHRVLEKNYYPKRDTAKKNNKTEKKDKQTYSIGTTL